MSTNLKGNDKRKIEKEMNDNINDFRVWQQKQNLYNDYILDKVNRNQTKIKNLTEVLNENEKNYRKKKAKTKNEILRRPPEDETFKLYSNIIYGDELNPENDDKKLEDELFLPSNLIDYEEEKLSKREEKRLNFLKEKENKKSK